MLEGRKYGRKKRPRITAEKLLMAEMSRQLYEKMKNEQWDKRTTAKKLGVCLASFYNYLNQNDLPGYEVLKRAHDDWGFKFPHLDFTPRHVPSPTSAESHTRQYVLPFIQSVRENDIEVVRTKSVKSDTLQVTINIKFAG